MRIGKFINQGLCCYFQMLLQEKADALREEAEEMIIAPEEQNGTETELNV